MNRLRNLVLALAATSALSLGNSAHADILYNNLPSLGTSGGSASVSTADHGAARRLLLHRQQRDLSLRRQTVPRGHDAVGRG